MNKLLILTSYTKFELNSWRNNEITIKLLIRGIFGCRDTAEVRNDVIFKNDYDVMNCFAKFEKFLPHSIIITSFMSVGSQMPELDRRGFFAAPPPYKISTQNTPHKLGLRNIH